MLMIQSQSMWDFMWYNCFLAAALADRKGLAFLQIANFRPAPEKKHNKEKEQCLIAHHLLSNMDLQSPTSVLRSHWGKEGAYCVPEGVSRSSTLRNAVLRTFVNSPTCRFLWLGLEILQQDGQSVSHRLTYFICLFYRKRFTQAGYSCCQDHLFRKADVPSKERSTCVSGLWLDPSSLLYRQKRKPKQNSSTAITAGEIFPFPLVLDVASQQH